MPFDTTLLQPRTPAIYSLTYQDENGEVITELHNNGQQFSATIRGVRFQWDSFISISPVSDTPEELLELFTLSCESGEERFLGSCTMKWTMTLPILVNGIVEDAALDVDLRLGAPVDMGYPEQLDATLSLRHGENNWISTGENLAECLDIIKYQFPEGISFFSCFGCGLSDYSPACAPGFIGDLICFRQDKERYRANSRKSEPGPNKSAVWNMSYPGAPIYPGTQETDICPEFEVRQSGTGYRG